MYLVWEIKKKEEFKLQNSNLLNLLDGDLMHSNREC